MVGTAGRPGPSRLDAPRRASPAYVVLACTLLLTFAAWRSAERTVRVHEQERFDRVVAMSREGIDRRLEADVQILMGVRALFAGSARVERSEFRSHVAGLGLAARVALASGHPAFVAKPFKPQVLTDRVRELLATADAGAA